MNTTEILQNAQLITDNQGQQRVLLDISTWNEIVSYLKNTTQSLEHNKHPLRGTTYQYNQPFEPASSDWDAL